MDKIVDSARKLRKLAVMAVNTFDATSVNGKTQNYADSLARLYAAMDDGVHAVQPDQEEPDLRELYGKLDESTLLLDTELTELTESNEYLTAFSEELLKLKVDILYFQNGD